MRSPTYHVLKDVASTVIDEGDRGGASDGLESNAGGHTYSTNYEHDAILCRRPHGMEWETVTHDPRLLWPDTLSLSTEGYLYVTANQLHRQARYNKGRDLRRKPYTLPYQYRRQAGPAPAIIGLLEIPSIIGEYPDGEFQLNQICKLLLPYIVNIISASHSVNSSNNNNKISD